MIWLVASIVRMDRNRAARIVILIVVLVESNDCLAACVLYVRIAFLFVLSEQKITRSGYYLHMRRTALFVLCRF